MKKVIIIVCCILGMIVGIGIGEALVGNQFLGFLSFGGEFGIKTPVTIDFSFLQFTVGFWCKVNIAGVVGMIVFALLGKTVCDWLRI